MDKRELVLKKYLCFFFAECLHRVGSVVFKWRWERAAVFFYLRSLYWVWKGVCYAKHSGRGTYSEFIDVFYKCFEKEEDL